jgi:hypothetical protein
MPGAYFLACQTLTMFRGGVILEIGLMSANVVYQCPCEFAQTPTYGDCEGVMAYHIRNGHYGETSLDGLNVLEPMSFKGNIWAEDTKATIAFFR